ncbi:hypothetical protein KQI69_02855 [Eubacterium sp. MSJ-13]|uniref:hypothetical protein n=1 Tax=Eubacterium sp. MSJ-13 TaxID=2841513 RepID=UPI001C121F48|nr:hypothetical protein [Eubacterium sp. MSJ-13]MBU5478136.1 hypothetical protein [Eubacterium sp. MSJ-13]
MFQWKKKNDKKYDEEKHDYNLTFDNVAIPEVHTNKTHEDTTENKSEHSSVNYDNLAIPEIHIKKK